MAKNRIILFAALCLSVFAASGREAASAPLQEELFGEAQQSYLKGDYRKAAENFRNARNMDPLNKTGVASHLFLGRTYEMAGEYEKALAVFSEIYTDYWNYRAFSPENDDVIRALLAGGDLYRLRLNKPEEALLRYGKLISDFPSSEFVSVARQSIVECYKDMGREDEVIKALDGISGAAGRNRSARVLKIAVPAAAALALLLTVLF